MISHFEGTLREVHVRCDETVGLVNTDGWLFTTELHNENGTDSFFTDADGKRVGVVMESLTIEES